MTSATQATSLKVALSAFLIVMVDGYDTLMISFIAPLLRHEWGLGPTDIGKIFASGYLGAVLGAFAMGPLADRLGRRPMLVGALILAGCATLASSAATSLSMFMAIRFVAGIALGGALPAVISLTAEHAKPERRAGTVTLMYIGFPAGAVIGGAITAALLHIGWRPITFGTGIACLLVAALALTLPDTVRKDPGHAAGKGGAMFTEQFADGRLGPALCLYLGLFCMLMLTYFLMSWTPTLIVDRGGSARIAALGGVVLNLGGITGALLMARTINRKGPYLPGAIMLALGSALIALVGQDMQVAFMLGLLFVCGICVMGTQLSFPAMVVELFPQRVRGAGAGWTMAFGRLGSIVGPLVGGALIAAGLGASKLFLLAAIPAAVAAACVFVAMILRRGIVSE